MERISTVFTDVTASLSWFRKESVLLIVISAWKVSKYGIFFGSYFPAFRLNTERYLKSVQIRSLFWSVFSCIRTEYGEIFEKYPNTDQKKLCIWTLFTQWILSKTDNPHDNYTVSIMRNSYVGIRMFTITVILGLPSCDIKQGDAKRLYSDWNILSTRYFCKLMISLVNLKTNDF